MSNPNPNITWTPSGTVINGKVEIPGNCELKSLNQSGNQIDASSSIILCKSVTTSSDARISGELTVDGGISAETSNVSCFGLSINSPSSINAVDTTQISDSNTTIPTSSVINSFISNAGIGEPFQFYVLTQDEITAARFSGNPQPGEAFGIRYWKKNNSNSSQSTYIGFAWYYISVGGKGTTVISGTGQYPWSN